jgi:hypothetical protein
MYRYSKHAFSKKKKCGHGRVCCAGDNESVCLNRRSGDEVYLMGSFEWYAQKDKWRRVEDVGRGRQGTDQYSAAFMGRSGGKEGWRDGKKGSASVLIGLFAYLKILRGYIEWLPLMAR